MSDIRPSRRSTLHALLGVGALAFGAAACGPGDPGASADASSTGRAGRTDRAAGRTEGARRLGAEWESHARTFMSWPARASVWGDDLPYVRQDIARIARAVAEYEYVVMMARPDQRAAAQKQCGGEVEVIELPVDDLWARDTVPVFVEEEGKGTGRTVGSTSTSTAGATSRCTRTTPGSAVRCRPSTGSRASRPPSSPRAVRSRPTARGPC